MLLALGALPIGACSSTSGPTADSPSHPVEGRVTVDGRPAAGVEVRLHPLNRSNDESAPRPQGTTDKDGRFRLGTGAGRDGAPSGQYLVTLAWPGPGGADRLKGTYAEPGGSGLTAIIEDSTTELPTFEVGSNAQKKAGGR